ncbi:hypothetical protein C8F04DRAFT_1269281 [Mycena alexandri]|uniref:C2H2-type domain-containing protein n=1 Tax=Mycena alexandri TaxID=1745969 RepID=A0AAD6SDT3_9AGAR|nr:hypothetical protein C8F04DRAFT_1269281 [Mycena alexandri]
MSSTLSSRRPSLAILYNKLQAQSDSYEELEEAARLFPMEDDEVVEKTYTAPSTFSTVSTFTPPRFDSSDSESDSDSDSDDSDSDVEPMYLNNDAPYAYQTDSVVIYDDEPFLPPRQQSPIIVEPIQAPPSPKPVSRKTAPRAKAPPPLRSRQRKRARSPVSDVDSDRDLDGESTGDASDDEYMPSPSLNPRKRARSASPASSGHTSVSPPASASSSSSSTSSEHRNKRPRLPPPSRNRQATVAEIQRVETSDDFNDFVCGVCGWVQKNMRVPDFKRHLKTHQRVSDEGAQKGWRCKGVLVSEATDYGLDTDAPTYTFLGHERVGGCMKTFSRRDALKRHLDNENVSCVGRPTAPTQE